MFVARRFLLVFLILTLTACNIPAAVITPTMEIDPTLEELATAEPATPQPVIVTETAIPTPQPVPATETAIPAPPTSALLTLAQLKNAGVQINGISPDAAKPRTVKLSDGRFESGSDRASADYVSVSMGEQVAYGDLNGDGLQDAAIIIGENYGGTGSFVSVVAMLNQNGQPVFASSALVDDRPAINSLSIQNGEILLDATIHGPNDPGCCPAQPVSESLRLWGGKLVQTRRTSKTPVGTERVITIDSPAQNSELSGPFTVSGSVTIAPFENSLAYSVFVEGTPDPVVQSSILVSATEMGGPGTFTVPVDLAASGITGNLRIEISDLSAADGSYLAIATLFVTIK